MPVWLRDADAFILDLDGTLWREGRPTRGAAELLRQMDGRFVLVSNNSTHDAPLLSAALAEAGLAVSPGRIVLAGELSVNLVASQHPGAAVMLLGSPCMRRLAVRLGLRLVDEAPDIVLLARDTGFDYAKLRAAANAVRDGARLVAANPDLTHPGADGSVVPETGSLLRAVLAVAGDVAVQVIGKPETPLFAEALHRLGGAAAATLVIGDNPVTDAAGAVRCGMPFLLVGDGPQADAADPLALLALARPPRRRLATEPAATGVRSA